MNFIDTFVNAIVPSLPRRSANNITPPERLFNWDSVVDAEIRLMDAKTRQIEALAKLEAARKETTMPLTEQERSALVEELAKAMHDVSLTNSPELFDTWEVEQTVEARHPDTGYVTLTREQATACLPIIERLLAERDMDALLDSAPKPAPHMIELGVPDALRNYHVKVWAPPLPPPHRSHGQAMPVDRWWRGTGPTRMAAIRNAVEKAKGEQGGHG